MVFTDVCESGMINVDECGVQYIEYKPKCYII